MDQPQESNLREGERRVVKTGKRSVEVTYGITSLRPDKASAMHVEARWRGHGTIENRKHDVRDVTLGEDRHPPCTWRRRLIGASGRCSRPIGACRGEPALAASRPPGSGHHCSRGSLWRQSVSCAPKGLTVSYAATNLTLPDGCCSQAYSAGQPKDTLARAAAGRFDHSAQERCARDTEMGRSRVTPHSDRGVYRSTGRLEQPTPNYTVRAQAQRERPCSFGLECSLGAIAAVPRARDQLV
jgi:hypothetical protein